MVIDAAALPPAIAANAPLTVGNRTRPVAGSRVTGRVAVVVGGAVLLVVLVVVVEVVVGTALVSGAAVGADTSAVVVLGGRVVPGCAAGRSARAELHAVRPTRSNAATRRRRGAPPHPVRCCPPQFTRLQR